jgi:hypothetical protein
VPTSNNPGSKDRIPRVLSVFILFWASPPFPLSYTHLAEPPSGSISYLYNPLCISISYLSNLVCMCCDICGMFLVYPSESKELLLFLFLFLSLLSIFTVLRHVQTDRQYFASHFARFFYRLSSCIHTLCLCIECWCFIQCTVFSSFEF